MKRKKYLRIPRGKLHLTLSYITFKLVTLTL